MQTSRTWFNTIIYLTIAFNTATTTAASTNHRATHNNASSMTCAPELSYNFVTKTCVDNDTALRIQRRPSCKNISLEPNFVLIQNGRLFVTANGENVSTDHYNIQNDNSTSFCYPLSPKFRACQRWGLYPDEFQLHNGGLTLRLTDTNATISAGDFDLNEAKFGVICVRNSRYKTYVVDAYATSWIISAVSLFASLVIYALTNRKLTYQTKTMMCHMLSLFVFYVLLTIRAWGPEMDLEFCFGYSVVVHYFFLASFFWTNVLAFDIWKNLPRFAANVVTPAKDRKRFLFMSVYAWGVPVLIAAGAVLTDRFAPEESTFRPQFDRHCWFIEIESRIIFLYGPAAGIIGANVIFFGLTVWSLKRLSKETMMANKKIHSQLTRMYMKLLIVMGLCWIMEIISGVIEKDDRYWYFTDIVNGLQGFFLFLVYVCKANVLRDLLALWIKYVKVGSGLCTKRTTDVGKFTTPQRKSTLHPDQADTVDSLSLSLSMNSRSFNP